jgi:acyl phosphate:glycerol-3-phosphate acyltransferase
MTYVVVAVAAYLIGAIPFAYLIVRLVTGRDIRVLGTGNVGVMNTVRQAGLPAGLLVFVAEGVKGVSALSVGRYLGGNEQAVLLAAFMALVGVNWSVFVGFAGGRGTTISLFMLVLISWQAFAILAVVWFGVYALLRNNFIATRCVIVLLPVTALLLKPGEWAYVACGVGMAGVLFLRHRRETDDHLAAVSTQPTTH